MNESLPTLRWIESPLQKKPSGIDVVYSALNFKDVTLDTSPLSNDEDIPLGIEFSGVQNKRRIMGIGNKAGITSYLNSSCLSWDIPNSWTLQDAATVPLAYIAAYYAFFDRFTIRKGQTILINLGAGGIGLAAIRVALAYGLNVFMSCNCEKSKLQLLKSFPGLKEANVSNSYEEIMSSERVDVVLNSSPNADLQRLIGCISEGGTLLDISETETALSNSLALNVSIIPVKVSFLLRNSVNRDLLRIKDMITTDIKKDIVQPLPSTVFSSKDIRQGFDFLLNEQPIEKVLIMMRDESNNNDVLPVPVVPRVYFSSERLYIIFTELELFDLDVINFMVLRGVRRLLLYTRNAGNSTYLDYRLS